jgi:hypothetical protein
VPCEHFAYMEPGLNWEIWIENGKSIVDPIVQTNFYQS